jgi:hypothetical protein
MKKINRVILVALIAAFTLLSPTSSFSTPKLILKVQNQETTVFITKTGEKYHRADCGYLRKSKIATTKADAIDRGYTPCSKCRP